MSERRSNTSKLNCDIDRDLKIRLSVVAKRHEKNIWQCVEEALKPYLDKEERRG
jgi:hypothetical protein